MLKVKAYAKINLFLRVLGRRDDGYHEIVSVMQQLALHDTLELWPEPGDRIRLETNAPGVPTGPDNLCMRAVMLGAQHTGIRKGLRIVLHKRIPVAAGLAGGSADAAATLMGLNHLWRLNLTKNELLDLGAAIGSDVPFCLLGGTALARGRGEELQPLLPAPQMGVVLVKAPFGLGAGKVYRHFDSLPSAAGADSEAILRSIQAQDVTGIASCLVNDLQRVVFDLHPGLRQVREDILRAGALAALVSGSGPTLFGVTPDIRQAEEVGEKLRRKGRDVIVTTTASGGPQVHPVNPIVHSIPRQN
ncbi:MAG: 4-(cytidine 5'-diphospho)-2-C-methyl-D-erythritol kinase [Peptococcaceae bacterium]|nr:4-(cytidine 5'-diphospho)-2-C-methyl-D-erythritol kinase [Peptococcaceae bacterium]